MTLREKMEIKWIEYTIYPSIKDRIIPFNESIKNAKRIVVLFPFDFPSSNEDRDPSGISDLFGRKELVGIFAKKENPGHQTPGKMISVFLRLDKMSLGRFRKCEPLREVLHQPVDLLIDLTSSPNTLGPYLCRITKAPLRICFGQTPQKSFYNLEYNGSDWNGLSAFLKNLMK
jgi:hypothetical protein